MAAESFLYNGSMRDVINETMLNMTNMSDIGDVSDVDSSVSKYVEHVSFALEGVAMPVVCAFGVIGNILNLAVLTHKQMLVTMENLEKSAHLGLVALAVSDLLFCLFVLINAFKPRGKSHYTSEESLFMLYYDSYVFLPVVSLLIVCSCWLTVVMALARYFAICRPLYARAFISLRGTRIALASVFVAAIIFNLPLFFTYQIFSYPHDNVTYYVQLTSQLRRDNERLYAAYNTVQGVVGVVVPVFVLAFCNVCLIRALRRSSRMQKQCTANRRANNNGHRITATLVVIIILFVVLALPAEALKFYQHLLPDSMSLTASKLANTTTNLLQACNFAVNFVLYCTLNAQFRKTVHLLLTYVCIRTRAHASNTSHVTSTPKGHHLQMTSLTGDPTETENVL